MSRIIAKLAHCIIGGSARRLWLVRNPDGFLTHPDVRAALRNEHDLEVVTASPLDLRLHFELQYRSNPTAKYIYVYTDTYIVLPDIKAEGDERHFDVADLFPLFADKPLLRRQCLEVLSTLYDMPVFKKVSPAQCKTMIADIAAKVEKERETSIQSCARALRNVPIDWSVTHQAETMRKVSEQLLRAIRLGHIDALRSEIATINDSFQQWMDSGYFASLNSNPLVRPQSVNKVLPHISANYPAQCADKVAMIVVDGMTYWQWLVLEERLAKLGMNPVTNTIVSWVPSITMLSRQALFRGDVPRMDYVQNPTNERKLWTEFWQNQGVWSNDTHYIYDGEHFDWYASTRRLAVCTVELDEMMHSSHHYSDLLDLTENWAQRFEPRIRRLKEDGFTIYLTTDHGNILADGWRILTPAEKVYLYASGSRGQRHLIYKPSANEAKEEMTSYGTQDVRIMSRDNFVCMRDTEAFIRPGQREITHGGCHFLEVVIPFVKI